MSQTQPERLVPLAPRPLHDLIVGLALVRVTREERLMILRAQIHIIERQRLFIVRQCQLIILGPAHQTHRILPHLTLGYGVQGRGGAQITTRAAIRAVEIGARVQT